LQREVPIAFCRFAEQTKHLFDDVLGGILF
jgi:hypothetical protein